MNVYVTRRPNGLYMLTRLPPLRVLVGMSDTEDLYVKPGDPIGVNNLCPAIVHSLMGELSVFQTVRGCISYERNTEPIELTACEGLVYRPAARHHSPSVGSE